MSTNPKQMSSFIITEDRILSFQEFCLTEAITPKQVAYGTNDSTDNGKVSSGKGAYITFFRDGKLTYAVLIQKHNDGYEVGFGASEVSNDYIENIVQFTDKRTNVLGPGMAAKVFSNVMYVVLEVVRKKGLTEPIYFHGADERLGKLYDNLMKNKTFLSELDKAGYAYQGKEGDYYKFVRK